MKSTQSHVKKNADQQHFLIPHSTEFIWQLALQTVGERGALGQCAD